MSKWGSALKVDGHHLEYRRIWAAHGVIQGWACSCDAYARAQTCRHVEQARALLPPKPTDRRHQIG